MRGGQVDAGIGTLGDAAGNALPGTNAPATTGDAPGLTPCRDLSPAGVSVASASPSSGQVFLVTGDLGASVVSEDGWSIPRTFAGHLGNVAGGALAADASWGATIGTDRALRIWRSSDGHELTRSVLQAVPKRIAASSTSNVVVVADENANLQAFDAIRGAIQWSIVLPDGVATSLFFSAGGHELIVGTKAGFERHRVSDGSPLTKFAAVAGGPAALSANGTMLAYAAPYGKRVEIARSDDGTSLRSIELADDTISALALTPDAGQVVIATNQAKLVVYNVSTGVLLRTISMQIFAQGMAVSSDGSIVAVAGQRVEFYRLEDGALLNRSGQTGFVWTGSFAQDGRLQFSGAGGPTQVWDPVRGVRLSLIERSTSGNQGTVAFAPSGLLLINHESSASYWGADLAKPVLQFDYESAEQPDRAGGMVFTPDGSKLIGLGPTSNSGQIRFWDASTGKLLNTLPGHEGGVSDLQVSPDGDLLASAGCEERPPADAAAAGARCEGYDIKLWGMHDGTLLRTLTGHTNTIRSIAFSNSGELLLSGDDDGLVRLWSVRDGAVVRDLASGKSRISGTTSNGYGTSVAFSPDGKLAASAGVDWTITAAHTGDIAIWSVDDGRLVGRLLSLAEANLGRIVWSPNGKLIAAGFGAGMRVWCLDELQAAQQATPTTSNPIP